MTNVKPVLNESQIKEVLGEIVYKTAHQIKLRLAMSLTIADCLRLAKTKKWELTEQLVYVIVAEIDGPPLYVGCTRKGYERIYAHYKKQGQRYLYDIIKLGEPFSLGFHVFFFKVEGHKKWMNNPKTLERHMEILLNPWIATRAWNGGIRSDDHGYTPWYIQNFFKKYERNGT